MATDTQTEPAVDARGLGRTYGSGEVAVHALHDADLTIDRGSFVVFLGPSGSGKTTLLNMVGGIERPTDGSLSVAGDELTAMNAAQLTRFRRTGVGFVFQFYNLVPTLTALENVQLVAELATGGDGHDKHGSVPAQETAAPTDGRKASAEDLSRAALEDVGLGDRLSNFPSALSGGQQQRVAIARAVVKRPPLLLADEPTGALDLETGRQVLGQLHRTSRQYAITVMLVTHNSAIATMADRVVHLRSGAIVGDDRNATPTPPDEVTW